MSLLPTILEHLQSVLADPTPAAPVPDPGGGQMPPGDVGEKVLLILKWVAGLATAACVGGILYTGGRMAIAHRRGDEANISQLGWVLFACLLIGSAAAIVASLI
ncbi:hypothetical protein [Catellatospora sp. NPDC049133]|uniref:hypothetical protein n=1 Tax=Catellatospora sp. NPDC049133 TaxID=3155499 RepID=UPI0033E46BCE